MYQKLFQITLVLFLVVVSVVILALLLSVLMSLLSPQLLAETGGITAVAGGLSNRQLGYMIVAASLIIAGSYLFFRRRRLRR